MNVAGFRRGLDILRTGLAKTLPPPGEPDPPSRGKPQLSIVRTLYF
jgi:hypothetical protein